MKKSLRIVFICVSLLLTPILRTFADDQLKEGRDALIRGDYLKAIEIFRDAAQNDKKNPEAFKLLGTALIKADSAGQAEAVLIQARELAPNDAQIFMLLGEAYEKQQLTAASLEQYKKAAEIDSMKPEIWSKVAEISRKVRKWNEARNAYIEVIKLDSTNQVALQQLGSIYYKAKQWANALPLYIRLEKIYPDSLPIQMAYVVVLEKNEFWRDLIGVAEKVVARDPGNTEIQTILAEALVKTGQIPKAIEQFEKFNPDSLNIEDLIRLAKAYKADTQYVKSIATFQRVLRRDSSRCDVPYDLGTTFMAVKEYSNAWQMFDKKIACDTSSGYQFAAHLNAAMSLMQLKKFKDAKMYVLGGIVFRPENIQAWQILAQCYGQLDDVDSEIVAYKKVVELATAASENGDAGKYSNQILEGYRMIGVRYLIRATKQEGDAAKKMYIAALEYLKKALSLDSKSCEIMLWVAQSFQNSGNKDEAKKYYCKLIEMSPRCKEAKDAQKGMDALGMKCGQ